MAKKPRHPMQSIVYLHKPTQTRYVIYHTDGDEHVMESISHRTIRVKKGDLENSEAWSKMP